MSARQIANAIEEDFNCVSKAIKKLIKHGEIHFIELNRIDSCKVLGGNFVSRRMRFFFNVNIPIEDLLLQVGLSADLRSR